MAASSSATSMLPAGMAILVRNFCVLSSPVRFAHELRFAVARRPRIPGVHWHQHSEYGVAWLGLAFDDPAMIADDLGDQREPQPGSGRLRRHERIEQVRQEIGRNPRPVVLDAEL